MLVGIDLVELMHPKALVSNYLMASYAYEHLHGSYMTDEAYDRVCQRLDQCFDSIVHPHKHLIDRGALSATTGYYLKPETLPLIVKNTAKLLLSKAQSGSSWTILAKDNSLKQAN